MENYFFKKHINAFSLCISLLIVTPGFSQEDPPTQEHNQGSVTSAHFLNMTSDVLAQGMGNIKNINPNSPFAIANNVSKNAFVDADYDHLIHSYAIGYNPIVQQLSNDIKLLNLSTNHWIGGDINNSNYLSFGIHYLGYGDMTFTDEQGNDIGFHRPNEFSVSIGYTKRIGQYFALGITPKYIRTNLSGNILASYDTYINANTFAVDLSMYGEYELNDYSRSFKTNKRLLTYGVSVQNIGVDVDYKIADITSKLPTNISTAFGLRQISSDIGYLVGLELSYPIYKDQFIPNNAQRLGYSLGAELSFIEQFFVRAGFIKESYYRNNTKMITLGTGFNFNAQALPISINGSYQLPFGDNTLGMKNNFAVSLSTFIFDR